MGKWIGKILCSMGFHKWEHPAAPTLRCVRCPKIVCNWAIGMDRSDSESKK